MNKLKQFLNLLFTKKFLSKFTAYSLLIIIFYAFSDFLGIFLLTFIFAYLFLTLAEFLKVKLDMFLLDHCVNQKRLKFLKKFFWLNFIIVSIYVIFVWIIAFIVSDMVPKLITELSELPKSIPFLAEPIASVTNQLVEIKNFNTELWGSISNIVSSKDIDVVLDILDKLKSASLIFLQVMLSIVLSFVFLIDRYRLQKYLQGIKKSSFHFLYKEYKIILEKIVKSFWLIFKAQAMIALANSILTVIWLIIIWLIHGWAFPYLLTLWLIVFIAWFIPVLWVFISSIPILIVAYSIIWWVPVLIEITLLIAIVHIVEAYYLNPKIVSSFLEIPVSLTFIVLIVSEHFFWIAGLLIWVSMFYFMVWLFWDIDKALKKKKKEVKRLKDKSVKKQKSLN